MAKVEFSPCYALMLGQEQPPALSFDAAVVKNDAIAWISVNNSKPGRSLGKEGVEGMASTSLLVQSDNRWAASNLEADQESVAKQLMSCVTQLTKIDAGDVTHLALHRWRYARVENNIATDFLLDAKNKLAACGDWCRGNRVEDAFLSGQRLGKEIRKALS